MDETRHRTCSQSFTEKSNRNNKWMYKKYKWLEKVNRNVFDQTVGWTKRSEAFKKLMVCLMISLLTISLLNMFY